MSQCDCEADITSITFSECHQNIDYRGTATITIEGKEYQGTMVYDPTTREYSFCPSLCDEEQYTAHLKRLLKFSSVSTPPAAAP